MNADTPEAANTPKDTVDELPGVQPLNASAETALSNTGTDVNTMQEDGDPTGTPAEQAKKASYYKQQLAGLISALNKKAAAEEPAAPSAEDFRTGTEVLQKFASLTSNSTEEDIADAHNDLIKLASTNPVFHICRDRILMEKMAEDIQALADAEGITPEQAAEELDAAAAANPEMVADLEDEASGEAVADLANAEAATDELMSGIQELADNASAATGTEITPDDIVNAADETVALAEKLGVPPEALIQAALEDMQGGAEGGDAEVTPEDEENAQRILEEAAANGISPEEVIQLAAEELQGAEAQAEEEPTAEATTEKAASLQKRASTMRAAFVQELRHS